MSFSEQADFSAEHTIEPGLIERLTHERDTVGSTTAYLNALGVYYESVPDHAANMLQLKRMARMVTNPNNEPSYPQSFTNAFYWGEILAYTSQDRLVGDEWATISYKLFNQNMIDVLERERDEMASHYDSLHDTADIIMGELEEADPEVMPLELDEFIKKWSGKITHDEEERWQIIFGFRHVIIQVENVALEYEYDVNPEAVVAANDFFEIVDATEIDDVQANLEPIDDVRDFLMDRYADHREAYGAIDESDEEALDDASIYLMQALRRDFMKSDRIDEGDFLEISGNAVFVICDDNLRTNNTYALGENEYIKGTFDAVAVTEVPTFDAIARIRRARENIDSDEVIPKGEVNPLGVLMILKDPVVVGPDGTHVQFATDVIAGVMLNNPDMTMSKYLL